jgi:hypothetical protein
MSWEPLLTGVWQERARESVLAIVEAVDAGGRNPADDPSLAGGTAGLAVLHGYLSHGERGPEHAAVARRCLREATAAVADNATPAGLYSGLTGVGWALAHLQGRLPGLDAEDELAEIDGALLDHLDRSSWTEDYDLVTGLVGFSVYALERLPRPVAVACLDRVIDYLAQAAQDRPEGVTWWTDPMWLPADDREQSPGGYYNLGLAHGVPAVIALLGRVCAAGIDDGRPRPLLAGAVRWLLAQQAPGGFPYWIGPGGENRPARLAWCYGDVGVAAALLGAARCVSEPAWEHEALEIARRAAQRGRKDAGVVDAGLCHGAAGLGHVFNRMYQATGEPWLALAARSWFERALAMRRPGRGVGGYEAWQRGDAGAATWVSDGGLLTGATGIALALLAATTAVEPAWDRMLMVAIPPAASS